MRPLIGLTTMGRVEAGQFALRPDYVDAVRRTGGAAVLIPPEDSRASEVLSRLDALVLTSGCDLAISCNPGTGQPPMNQSDRERDAAELELVQAAVAGGFPTLGICRGLQVLAV